MIEIVGIHYFQQKYRCKLIFCSNSFYVCALNMLCRFLVLSLYWSVNAELHFTLATHSLCCACRSLFTRTAGAPIYAKITIEDNWLLSYCMLAQKCGRHGSFAVLMDPKPRKNWAKKKGEFDSPSNKWCLDRSQKNEKKTKNNRRRRHGTHKRDENWEKEKEFVKEPKSLAFSRPKKIYCNDFRLFFILYHL